MANLDFCNKHNMVAFLKKPKGSAGFHQIVDFLNSTHIKYALTENPTIYVSLIHQFWQTASASTSENEEMEITATIDGRVKTVTEASIRRHLKNSKGYNGVDIPLFPTMLVQGLIFQGEGSTVPVESHHIPTVAPSTSPPHILPTLRSPIRQETKVPQLSSPPHTNVANEAASTGVDVRHGGAATTVTSLDIGQGSGNINKTPFIPHDSPLPRGHTLGSDEGRMQQNELMDLFTKFLDKYAALETDLRQTKKVYGDAFTRLIKKVKKLEKTVKTSQAIRRSRVVISDDEEELEDPSKQGRIKVLADAARKRREVVNVQSYTRRRREVSTGRGEISTAKEPVSTAGASMPVSTAGMVQEAITPSSVATKDKEVALKLQEEFDAAERQRMAQVHQAAQGFTDAEWDDILARKKFFARQRAEAKRNKPMTPAQQKDYMSNYIKNQKGATIRRVQSFVPMDSELEVQRLKRAGQEVSEKPVKRQKIGEASGSGKEHSAEKEKELSQEDLQQMMMVVPVEEVYV
ncbi:hypothetical protein Tco_0311492 [Tanacetum coccineum]